MKSLNFLWKKLALLSAFNILISFIFIYLYRINHSALLLWGLFFWSLLCTVIYLLMVNTLAPKNYSLKFFILFTSLTPFLALPLIATLKYYYNNSSLFFNKTNIILLTIASIIALTMSIRSTEFLSKKELLIGRILPPEIAFLILSTREAAKVSALTHYESVSTPLAVSKIQKLRQKYHPDFSSHVAINPNAFFRVLPLGFAWIRGAPTHAAILIHFHYLQRK